MEVQACHISCGVQQIYGLTNNPAYDALSVLCFRAKVMVPQYFSANRDYQRYGKDAPYPTTFKEILAADKHIAGLLPAQFIFSDAEVFGRGERLAKYIEDNKLGSIVCSTANLNANSTNQIRTWIWGVDKRAFVNHFIEVLTNNTELRDMMAQNNLFGVLDFAPPKPGPVVKPATLQETVNAAQAALAAAPAALNAANQALPAHDYGAGVHDRIRQALYGRY